MNRNTNPLPADKDMDTLAFDQLPLQVGDVLRLTSNDDGAGAMHYTVQFIGALQGKGLITSLPVAGNKGAWMPPGGSYVVRVLSGTHAYAFTSQVLRARASPYPHVHFQYPAVVQARKVRQSLRVSMNLGIEIVDDGGGGNSLPATLLDLSMHGARLETAESLVGDQVQLTLPIKLDEADNSLRLRARVRNLKGKGESGMGQPLRLGVEFEKLEKPDALLLHYFIDHAIAEHGAALL